MPRRPTEARTPLTRDRVVREAVALADAEGLEAVSMRALADRLGVVPMALYKHVADKEDLLDGMVDRLVEGFGGDPSPGDWPARFREVVAAARDSIRRHPWSRRAIETRTRRTLPVLRHMERLTRILIDGGASPDLAHHAMHALGNRIWGFSPELFDDPDPGGPRRRGAPVDQPRPEDFPAIMAVSAEARRRRPGADGCDEDFEFDFALDLLLEGIAGRVAAGWESPAVASAGAGRPGG